MAKKKAEGEGLPAALMSKSDWVRDFKSRHPDTSAKEVVEAAKVAGITMTEQTVYQAMKPKASATGSSKPAAKAKPEGNPVASLKVLVDALGAEAVKDMVDLIGK